MRVDMKQYVLMVAMVLFLAGASYVCAGYTNWQYNTGDLYGATCLQERVDELDDRLDDIGMTAENDLALDLTSVTLSDGVYTDDTEYNGAPLAVNPASYYTYHEDCFVAGYVAGAATTNEQNVTILQGGKFSEVADQAEWLVSVTDGDGDDGETIVVADDQAGGVWEVTCNNKADDAVQVQKNGEGFAITTSKDLWFEAKVAIEDIAQDTAFVGLTVSDTDVLGSLGNDFIGFHYSAATNLDFKMAKNGTIVTNAGVTTLANATAKRLGFFVDGSASNVIVYVDGVAVATNAGSASVPNDEVLSPAAAIKTADTGADYIRIDYINVRAQR